MDDLAAYIKQSSNKVIADLKYAIKRKLIPEGHFGTDQMIILMSDDTYAKYQMHQTEFDRYYRKQLEERVRMEERSENIQSILNQGISIFKLFGTVMLSLRIKKFRKSWIKWSKL